MRGKTKLQSRQNRKMIALSETPKTQGEVAPLAGTWASILGCAEALLAIIQNERMGERSVLVSRPRGGKPDNWSLDRERLGSEAVKFDSPTRRLRRAIEQ